MALSTSMCHILHKSRLEKTAGASITVLSQSEQNLLLEELIPLSLFAALSSLQVLPSEPTVEKETGKHRTS